MLAFIIRRLLQAIVVMLTVALIAFTLFRFVGDPVNMMVGIETTAEERAQLRQELASASAIFSLLIGIPMGVYTALHRRSWLSNIFLAASLIGISLPTFLIGILLIFLFPVTLGILPSFGRGDVVRIGFWTTGLLTASGLKALIGIS